MFSQMMMPMSTIVPIAMAMPESATMFASTPVWRMPMKHMSTARGRSPEIRTELRRWRTITTTTMIVTRICWIRASLSVPSVS